MRDHRRPGGGTRVDPAGRLGAGQVWVTAHSGVAWHDTRTGGPWKSPDSAWQHGRQPDYRGAQQAPPGGAAPPRRGPPPPPPQQQQAPAAPPPQRGPTPRQCGLLALVLLLLAGGATALVLYLKGVFSSGKGAGGTAADAYTPLPYFQRPRNPDAPPVFQAELHAYMLPAEQAALGLPALDADVIIIGAGAAGLAAADVLRGNMSVIVLEARDRVGGRILSIPFGRRGAVSAELGAQFIWGSASNSDSSSSSSSSSGSSSGDSGAHPLIAEANWLGLERVMVGYPDGSGPRRRYIRGVALGPSAGTGAPLDERQVLSLKRWQADFAAAASNATSANQSLVAAARPQELYSHLGLTLANSTLLEAALEAEHSIRYGARMAGLSALYYDHQISFPGPDNVVLGGMERLPRSYAAALLDGASGGGGKGSGSGSGARLQLSTPVVEIQHGDSSARVVTASGHQLSAQFVICTVPLGVLQAPSGGGGGIRLDPPLPQQTQAALRGLGVGHLEKLWLEFDEPFWEDQLCGSGEQQAPCEQLEFMVPPPFNWSGTATSSQPSSSSSSSSSSLGPFPPWRRFVSMAAYTRRPVLVALAAAEGAQRLRGVSDEEAVASAMAALRTMFFSRTPAGPRVYLLSRWGQDPWARGALSYYAVGGTPSDRATLAEPQSGSLILAGEAMSVRHPSTVHGALLSGREAAYRVLDAAAELPQCGSGDSSSGGGGSGGGGAACVVAVQGGGGSSLQCDCAPELF